MIKITEIFEGGVLVTREREEYTLEEVLRMMDAKRPKITQEYNDLEFNI